MGTYQCSVNKKPRKEKLKMRRRRPQSLQLRLKRRPRLTQRPKARKCSRSRRLRRLQLPTTPSKRSPAHLQKKKRVIQSLTDLAQQMIEDQ